MTTGRDAARWRRIEEVFQAAVKLPPDRRAAFLDRECAGDPGLRREVESLLAADGDNGTLKAAVEGEAASLGEELADSWTGRRLGPYRISRELGRGGMGVVYLADRVDGQYRQRVTIKLVRQDRDTEGFLRRFRNERQILATLHHPNIARLLDGGTLGGLPYYVMEYIEGEPIDRYCDRHRLPVERRLELFCKVCSAVHFAHQNLVVHRDIKPANVLVTADGEPQLLDFGIAKLLDPEALAFTVEATAPEVRPMTLGYAAPEQYKGEPITTAADVCSLGLLLYELLTGHPARRFRSSSPQELERVICDAEPEKPSTAVLRVEETEVGKRLTPESVSELRSSKPEALRRRLAGDLDNIVLMAVRKEPGRRYASVRELADDIGRHLRALPVIARPDTVGYRTGKFVRRHKLGVAFAALLVAFAVGMTVQSVRLARQRDAVVEQRERAETERGRAEQVSDFLVRLFAASHPSVSRGETVTAREILDRGAQRIDQELQGQQEMQAKLMITMGSAYMGLGLYDDAEPLIDRGLEIQRQLSRGEERAELADSLNARAQVLAARNEWRAAERLFREALRMRQSLRGAEHRDVAQSLNDLGLVLFYQGRADEAEGILRQALAMRRRLLGEEHLDVAESQNDLAEVLKFRGAYEEAAELHRKSLATSLRLRGEGDTLVALNLNNLGVVLHLQGDLEGAEPRYREALRMFLPVLGDEHPQVALVRSNLGALLHARGDYRGAEEQLHAALAVRRRVLGGDHPDVAIAANNLAGVLVDRGRPAEAESLVREALEILRRSFPAGHPRIAYAESTLGACLAGLGRDGEAEPLLVQSYPILEQQTGETSAYTRTALRRLVTFYEARGEDEKAAAYRALLESGE